ncbi:MAG: sulfurtransferase-like selenium metabolism protein YedF [Dehalococcoidales bacterium]|jgi:selenium metabolism protein YedF
MARAGVNKNAVTVLITGDKLGRGDDRLGEILMKSFLNTLWDSDPKPRRIIFINSGVLLAAEGSGVLDTLELLRQAGVSILSCGTCLDFYELRAKLQAGEVTKMPDIVAHLLAADKVVTI